MSVFLRLLFCCNRKDRWCDAMNQIRLCTLETCTLELFAVQRRAVKDAENLRSVTASDSRFDS